MLTTETCLLSHATATRALDARATIERRLRDYLGARTVLWLGERHRGDDTDGHVDDLARFVAPGVVVAACRGRSARREPRARSPTTCARLRAVRDSDGERARRDRRCRCPPAGRARGARLPASYANFYVANGAVLVPVFGARQDERALAVLREALAGRDVIPIPARHLVVGLGSVHCLSQQEPAPG